MTYHWAKVKRLDVISCWWRRSKTRIFMYSGGLINWRWHSGKHCGRNKNLGLFQRIANCFPKCNALWCLLIYPWFLYIHSYIYTLLLYIHVYLYILIYILIFMYIIAYYTYLFTYILIHIYTYIYICTYIYVYLYICNFMKNHIIPFI